MGLQVQGAVGTAVFRIIKIEQKALRVRVVADIKPVEFLRQGVTTFLPDAVELLQTEI